MGAGGEENVWNNKEYMLLLWSTGVVDAIVHYVKQPYTVKSWYYFKEVGSISARVGYWPIGGQIFSQLVRDTQLQNVYNCRSRDRKFLFGLSCCSHPPHGAQRVSSLYAVTQLLH